MEGFESKRRGKNYNRIFKKIEENSYSGIKKSGEGTNLVKKNQGKFWPGKILVTFPRLFPPNKIQSKFETSR